MNRTIAIIFLTLATGVLAGCPRITKPRGKEMLGEGKFFTVAIEQDGRCVGLVNNRARLDKKPFTVILTFSMSDGVMVNASTSPSLLKAVQAGRSVQEILPIPIRGLPEYLGNLQQQIFITDKGYNYWYRIGDNHRFDDVTESKGRFVCRRRIANVHMEGATALIPIGSLNASALHLVFVKTILQAKQRVPKQTEYLTLVFE